MSNIAIRIKDLVKEYEIYARPVDLAIEVLTRRPRHTTFRALNGVNLEVVRGEVLGIIGSNGAGKSTLLKVITGVLEATSGTVDVAGRVTAILELGLGFNPEFSGRENTYLSGLLYGMDRAEVSRKIDEIIDFSGLGEFIERPVKTYSSGMYARLAFSIATAVDPDILIIDEALAAGDAAFVQKCLRRIRQLCSGGRTVILVSHGTGLLAQLCQRVVWMERGQVRMVGSAINIVQAYDLAAHESADGESWIEEVADELDDTASPTASDLPRIDGIGVPASGSSEIAGPRDQTLFNSREATGKQVFRRGPVFIDSVEMFDHNNQPTTRLTLLRPFRLKVHYRVDGPLAGVKVGIALAINSKHDLAPVAQYFTQNVRPFETRETYDQAVDRFYAARRGTLLVSFDYVPFRKGEYFLSIGLLPNEPATWEFYEYRHFYYSFTVDDAAMDLGAPIMLYPGLSHIVVEDEKDVSDLLPETPTHDTLRKEIQEVCLGAGGYPDQWPRHEVCPACGVGKLVFAFAKYGFQHSRCVACEFVCLDPYPPETIIAKLYSGSYYSQVRSLFEQPLMKAGGASTPFSAPREVLRSVVHATTEGRSTGRWLDVGGGLGAFANLVRQMKPNWEVQLNEMNPQSISIARELFDFKVVSEDPAELFNGGELFDVVSSVAVLEHVTTPLEFLRSYAATVKPGGWLVMVVPHFTRLNSVVSQGSSPNVVPPYHVSLFNEYSLRALLERVEGLEFVSIEQMGAPAFDLIHHLDYGDCWDIKTPSIESPEPRSVQVRPYSAQESDILNALANANSKMGDYFAKRDGRLFLVAYCRRVA